MQGLLLRFTGAVVVVVKCISCPQVQLCFFFNFILTFTFNYYYYLFTIFGVLNEKKKTALCFWDGSLLCVGSSWRVFFWDVKCNLQNTTQIMERATA